MNDKTEQSPAVAAESAGAPLLECEKLGKIYRTGPAPVAVLNGLELRVAPGRTTAIMGASGAGKTTLLHILGGLDRPTSGAVRWRGRDLYAMSNAERARVRSAEIGFVFQSYYLLPELDVLENVMLPAMSLPRALRRRGEGGERAAELLKAVGLAHRLRHLPVELSGGEQQRAAVARALMNDPLIVLADEPTGNLDPVTGGRVLDYLFSLVAGGGKTLLVVTHNAEVAARCDGVLRLAEGRLSFLRQ